MTSPAVKPTTPDDTELLAQSLREQLLARMPVWPNVMPEAMRNRAQWVLWRLEWNEERDAAVKTPYYASGRRRGWPLPGRQSELGGPEDRAALTSIDVALARFRNQRRWTGIGFAFLEDDGLIAIDLDGTVDLDTGELHEQHRDIIEACASYTERSPSGTGFHIICAGATDSFKHDPCGVEVYCGGRYFACTGDRIDTAPAEVEPLRPFALAFMRQVVERSKADAREAKRAVAPVTTTSAAPAPPAPRATGPLQKGEDFRMVNEAALRTLSAWVPLALPDARVWKNGFRITSKALGRDLQEDLQLLPEGIMDFGEEEGLSPIDVVLKFGKVASTARDAMLWLAPKVGVQIEDRRAAPPRARAERRPEPPAEEPPVPQAKDLDSALADAARDGQPAKLRLVHSEPAQPPEAVQPASGGRGKKRARRTPPEGEGGKLTRLLKHFRLIYGLKSAWDGERREIVPIDALRLAFGHDEVKWWLSSPDRMDVYQEDIVFQPGKEVPDHQVNLFDGLEMEPERCEEEDVQVMLDLLKHLCSESAPTAEGCKAVMDWVLQWLAFPLQHLGAKLKTALVFHGPQGTGKNLFFDTVRAMYGKYGRMVGQTELDDKYTDWLSAKLMIVGNEVVTRQELFHNKNRLKWIVTEDEVPIRGMYRDTRWESNHAQVVFLSNEIQPLALEYGDRRYLVVYTPVAHDNDLYLRVADFLAEGGAAKFMYFLQRYDTSGFNEHTKPLMTEAKQNLISLGLKPAERFVMEWLEGFVTLPVHVCEAGQLYKVFRRWGELNGERSQYVRQEDFTSTVKRFVSERVERDPETGVPLDPRLRYTMVAYEPTPGQRTTMRVWIPRGCEPPNGVRVGDWAYDCKRAFEHHVARYGRAYSEDDAK